MRSVDVHCFPSGDEAPAREVNALLLAQRPAGRGGISEPGVLQAMVRLTYPEAIVSARHEMAGRGDEMTPVWYVFRDGGLAARAGAPRRILVVDDDPDFAQMLEAMLVGAGFLVRRARDGGEAFDTATEFAPSLILLDLAMPRTSGQEFADRYRQAPEPKAQLVIVSGMPDAWKRAQAADARAVVRKPFEMDSFLKLVRHLA